MRTLLKRVFLILLFPLILLSLAEFFLRISSWNNILGPQRFSGGLEDHSLFWDPENIIKIPIDKYRFENEFRDRKEKVKKPNNVYRIICLGGSFTYGWPYNRNPQIAYPAILEKILNSSAGGKIDLKLSMPESGDIHLIRGSFILRIDSINLNQIWLRYVLEQTMEI